MKKVTGFFFVALLSVFTVSTAASQQDSEFTDMMLGDWNCEYQSSSGGLIMLSKSISSVTPDTIWVREFVQIQFEPELSNKLVDESLINKPLHLELTYNYQWLIKDNRFISVVTDMQLNYVSDERMSRLLGITDGYLIGMTSIADILHASKEKLIWRYEVEEDNEGIVVTCLRQNDRV